MSPEISLIFDLDGTLFDTAPGLVHTMNALLARRGRGPLGLDDIKTQLSFGARAIMKSALEQSGLTASADELEELFGEFIRHYTAIMADMSHPYPGLVRTLERFEDAGCVMGVCTNRFETSAMTLINALGLKIYFKTVIGQDSIGIAKPDPAPVFETLARMGGEPSRAIFIGDSEVDVAAARAAGMPVIVVSFGYASIPALELGADLVIDHFDELEEAVNELARRPRLDLPCSSALYAHSLKGD